MSTSIAFRPAPGFDEILMAGEIEWRKCEKARVEGFEIGENLYEVLRETNRALGFEYDTGVWVQ
jgi:LDH2 family malate/lactate/ureidoglycolate dehydrogenase